MSIKHDNFCIIKTYVPGLQWVDAQLQMNHQELRDAYQQIGQVCKQLGIQPIVNFD